MTKSPFRYFKTSPEIIQLAVVLYVKFPLSLRNVEDLLLERGIAVCHETVRHWVDRFGTFLARKIQKRRSGEVRQHTQWQWHLDEIFVNIRGEIYYLWRAVDHEGEVLESFVTKTRDKASALKFMRKATKCYGNPQVVVTDRCHSYRAAVKEVGNARDRSVDGISTIALKTCTCRFDDASARYPASGECEVYRSSLPSTLQCTITVISKGISTPVQTLRRDGMPHFPNGGR